jgi:hypothetical protein
VKREEPKSTLKSRLAKGAGLLALGGAGLLTGRIRSVKNGLSAPYRACEWDPGRGRSVFLRESTSSMLSGGRSNGREASCSWTVR